jgi:hypothetical protein
VTEHDHRVCPRCAQEAGDYHFCPSCLAPIDSLSGIPAHARVSGESQDALAETAATALQVETERRSTEEATTTPPPELPLRADARLASQPARDVARFEDVLTVGPSPAAKAAPSAASEISLHPNYTPPAAVARLEDVLTVAASDQSLAPVSVPPPAPAPTPLPAPRPADAPASEPPPLAAEMAAVEVDADALGPDVPTAIEVAAQALREAFWFEQASASKATGPARMSIPPPAPAPESERTTVEVLVTDGAVASPELPSAAPAANNWVTAAFLLALVALLVALTGRRRPAN